MPEMSRASSPSPSPSLGWEDPPQLETQPPMLPPTPPPPTEPPPPSSVADPAADPQADSPDPAAAAASSAVDSTDRTIVPPAPAEGGGDEQLVPGGAGAAGCCEAGRSSASDSASASISAPAPASASPSGRGGEAICPEGCSAAHHHRHRKRKLNGSTRCSDRTVGRPGGEVGGASTKGGGSEAEAPQHRATGGHGGYGDGPSRGGTDAGGANHGNGGKRPPPPSHSLLSALGATVQAGRAPGSDKTTGAGRSGDGPIGKKDEERGSSSDADAATAAGGQDGSIGILDAHRPADRRGADGDGTTEDDDVNANGNDSPAQSSSKLPSKKRRRKEEERRRYRRRRWTAPDGTPSLLAVLTSPTPPPSDDEVEVLDTRRREKAWREEKTFTVDVDAFLGLKLPEDLPEEERSSMYRVGSSVRARVWDEAVRIGGGGDDPGGGGGGGGLLLDIMDAQATADGVWSSGSDPLAVGSPASSAARRSLSSRTAVPNGVPSSRVGGKAGGAAAAAAAAAPPSSSSSRSPPSAPARYHEGTVSLSLPDDPEHLPELHCIIRSNLELFSATDADVNDRSFGKRTPVVRGKVGIRCVHCARAAGSGGSKEDAGVPRASSSDGSGTLKHAKPDGTVASSSSVTFVHGNSVSSVSVSAAAGGPSFTRVYGAAPQTPLLQPRPRPIAGAVTYPATVSTIYSLCVQKPANHFANCTYTPHPVRNRLYELTHDEIGDPIRQRVGSSVVGRLGLNPVRYWAVAARRLGLVDAGAAGGGGVRFGRDVALGPRGAEEVIEEDPTLAARPPVAPGPVPGARVKPEPGGAAGPAAALASAAAARSSFLQPSVLLPRISADEESERVLAEAVAEMGHTAVGATDGATETEGAEGAQGGSDGKDDGGRRRRSSPLVRPEDKDLATDFTFLAAAQMALVHANPMDMLTKGKKSRTLRIGFAGFTCRHCVAGAGGEGSAAQPASATEMATATTGDAVAQNPQQHHQGYHPVASNSFASTPEALATAISQNLYWHLQKCAYAPPELKRALGAYKKLHSKQMGRLAKGAVGRFYKVIFSRIREQDLPREQISNYIDGDHAVETRQTIDATSPSLEDSAGNNIDNSTSSRTDGSLPASGAPESISNSMDEETRKVLDAAAKEDSTANGSLIRPEDRGFMTDFLFLLMKQLAVTHLTVGDKAYRAMRARVGFSGLCCRHCSTCAMTHGAVGRSFPTAPDNFATALKDNMFNHIIQCQLVPVETKEALSSLKALHSIQMARLPFGAQRHYFRLLFGRLRDVDKSHRLNQSDSEAHASLGEKGGEESNTADDETLEANYFSRSPSGWFACTRCRMVPLELRAPGSLSLEQPSEAFLRRHRDSCKGDAFDLSTLVGVVREMTRSVPGMTFETLLEPSFKAFVGALVDNECDLVEAFTVGLVNSETPAAESRNAVLEVSVKTNGLWTLFPAHLNSGNIQTSLRVLFDNVECLSPIVLRDAHFLNYIRIVAPACVDLPLTPASKTDEP